jgi:hypothetical protein
MGDCADYRAWKIGITHEVSDLAAERRKPKCYRYWQAESLKDAQAIVSHFVKKGMQGHARPKVDAGSSIFIYIC